LACNIEISQGCWQPVEVYCIVETLVRKEVETFLLVFFEDVERCLMPGRPALEHRQETCDVATLDTRFGCNLKWPQKFPLIRPVL